MPLTVKKISISTQISGYAEWLPEGWDKVKKVPVFIFIHGIGDVGNDPNMVLRTGLMNMINVRKTFPLEAIVIAPQFKTAWPGAMAIQNVINYVKNNYVVDTTRIYLTGLSMGGGSIVDWGEAGTLSDIAAIAPVCPATGFNPATGLKYVAENMPFYFYHGDADKMVDISSSRGWVNGLNNLKISPAAKLFVVPGGQHNVWDGAYEFLGTEYDGKNMYDWCLQYSKGTVVTPPPVPVEAEFSFPGGKYTLMIDKTWAKS